MNDDIYDLRRLRTPEGFAKATGSIIKAAEHDASALAGWRRSAVYDLAARYGVQGGDGGPDPGASSNYVVPIDDKYVTRHRAVYAEAMFNHEAFCHCIGLDDEGRANADKVSMYMQSLLSGSDPVFSVKDFKRTAVHALDDAVCLGFSVLHSEQDVVEEPLAPRTISRRDLPKVLQNLIVGTMKDEARQLIAEQYRQRGIELNPQEMLETYGEPVNPMNTQAFDEFAGITKQLLVNKFRFGDSATDRKACDKIMRWIRSGEHQSGEAVEVLTTVMTRNSYRIDNIHPENVILPVACRDPERAQRITIIRDIWDHDLIQMANHQDWDDDAVNAVLERSTASWSPSSYMLNTDGEMHQLRRWLMVGDGWMGSGESEPRRIATTYTWADLDSEGGDPLKLRKDSNMQRVRLTYDATSGDVLDFCLFRSRIPRWPIGSLRFDENCGPLIASRGLPRMIRDPSRSVTTMHRGRHNHIAMMSAMQGVVRRQTVPTQGGSWTLPFGSFPEVDDVNDVKFASWPTTAPAMMLQDESITTAYIDDFVGEVSPSRQRRGGRDGQTAYGARVEEGKSRALVSARMTMLLDGMRDFCTVILAQAQESPPAEHWTVATGSGQESMTGLDLRGRYKVALSARPEDASPEARYENAMQLYALAKELKAVHGRDPRYQIDDMLAGVNAARAIGLSDSRDVIKRTTPEQEAELRRGLQEEAERRRALEETVAKMRANIPVDPKAMAEALAEYDRKVPHRGWQKVETELRGEAAEADLLAGAGGGGV